MAVLLMQLRLSILEQMKRLSKEETTMALFESYERRIDQINSVLNSYGIASIEEAEKITKDAGLRCL